MSEVARRAESQTDSCARCLSPVSSGANRCTHCGAPVANGLPAPFFAGAAEWRVRPAPVQDDDFSSRDTEITRPPQPPVAVVPDDATVVGTPTKVSLAPPWRRVTAILIDSLPVLGAGILTMMAFERRLELAHAPLVPGSLSDLGRVFWALGPFVWLLGAVLIVIPVAYQTFSLAYMGGSVGDLLLGIHWVTKLGAMPTRRRALIRAALAVPLWALALFGVWFMLLTRTRRTLYDVICGVFPIMR